MTYPFGQDFTYTFYPLVDNDAAKSIPTDAPSIYVFDSKPDRTVAALGTGAIKTIVTWTAKGAGFNIAITAINDPSPTSETETYDYWIAINFRLKSGGQVQTVIKLLEMERVFGHHKSVNVTRQGVIDRFPEVAGYVTEVNVDAMIESARIEVKTSLTNRSIEWATIWRPDELYQAILMKTMMLICLDQRKQPGDNFDANFAEYKTAYTNALSSIDLHVDPEKTGAPQAETIKPAGYAFIIR